MIQETSSPHSEATILVVDDEESVRTLAALMLQGLGYQTVSADSGEQALQILANPSARLDLVLLDLTMPGLSGEETLTLLRRDLPDLPVIIMSGMLGGEVLQRLAVHRVSGFIDKPFTLATLGTSVEQALGLS